LCVPVFLRQEENHLSPVVQGKPGNVTEIPSFIKKTKNKNKLRGKNSPSHYLVTFLDLFYICVFHS
jgi:hypothetical protein